MFSYVCTGGKTWKILGNPYIKSFQMKGKKSEHNVL